jgi:hypothetical protein
VSDQVPEPLPLVLKVPVKIAPVEVVPALRLCGLHCASWVGQSADAIRRR